MGTKRQFYVIDILKLFFCVCIILLHSELWKLVPGELNYWVKHGIFRLGVPFFFITSGFMFGKKYHACREDARELKKVCKAYTLRLLKPLIVLEVIGFTLDSIYYFLQGRSFLWIMARSVRSVIFYPIGTQWFLQACIVGVWMIYFFASKKLDKWILPVGIVLYAGGGVTL